MVVKIMTGIDWYSLISSIVDQCIRVTNIFRYKISGMRPTGGNLSVSLNKTTAEMRNNPFHADQKILSNHRHIILKIQEMWSPGL